MSTCEYLASHHKSVYASCHFQTCDKLLLRLARALVLTKRNIFVWLQPTLVSRATLGSPSNENADLFDVSFPTGSLMFSYLRNFASCLRLRKKKTTFWPLCVDPWWRQKIDIVILVATAKVPVRSYRDQDIFPCAKFIHLKFANSCGSDTPFPPTLVLHNLFPSTEQGAH